MSDSYSVKKITELTEVTTSNDADLFVLGNEGTANMRKVTFANLANWVKVKIGALVKPDDLCNNLVTNDSTKAATAAVARLLNINMVAATGYNSYNVLSQLSQSTYLTPTTATLHLVGKRMATLYVVATVRSAMAAGSSYTGVLSLPTALRPAVLTGFASTSFTGGALTGGGVNVRMFEARSVNDTMYITISYILGSDYSA